MSIKNLYHRFAPYIQYILALVPVMAFREFTPRNELRYLAIVDEALRDGTFWSFTFEGVPYADKPPLYFWLLMAAKSLLGQHVNFVICLFSLIPAIGILAIMNRWMKEYGPAWLDRELSWWMLATCGLQLGMAVFARMDMLMSLWIVWAMYLFWQMTHTQEAGRKARLSWLMGLAVFLAIFSKGPLGILIPLVGTSVYMAFSGSLGHWTRVWNWRVWTVVLAGCAAWWTAVYLEGGPDYLNNMLFHQTVDRAVDSFHHQRPWWFYLTTTWYTTLPWGPLCLVTMIVSLYKRTWSAEPLQKFFTLVFLSTLVMLSMFSGKLDVYLLPAYPFLVYGSMLQFCRWMAARRARKGLILTCRILMAIIFVAGLLIPFVYDKVVAVFS